MINLMRHLNEEKQKRGHFAEITFIGVNKAKIKEHKKLELF